MRCVLFSSKFCRAIWLGLLVFACRFGAEALVAAPAPILPLPPLHERIDAVIESEFAGPLTPPAREEDFLRRVHLDLTGRIPTTAEARAFFSDTASDKRIRLVERLLASPQHARHLATFFDVMFMERRPEKHVKTADWQQFLFNACLTNQPYHLLVRDILAADSAHEPTRVASRFQLDREADPAALTRDTGRIFFGMDLSCAQCHDHPNIADYLQREYHGLFAFFNRTYLLTRDSDKKAFIAEKADGEVTFTSVFTKETGATRPRLPGAAQLVEPVLARGAEYLVPPDPKNKNLRPVPQYSRRAALAKAATETNHRAFNRNIVNRLWAMMLGRPLAGPVDELHSANPPAYPALLDLLAREFAASGYDTRAFLRELALTRVYGRSFELPTAFSSPRGLAATWIPVLEARQRQVTNDVAAAELAVQELRDRIAAQRKAALPVADELAKTNAAIAEIRKACDPGINAHRDAERELARKREGKQSVEDALARLAEALAKLPADKEVTASVDKLKARSTELAKEIETATKDVTAKDTVAKPLREKLAAAEATATAIRARWATEEQRSWSFDSDLSAALTRWQDAKTEARHLEQRVETARALIDADQRRQEVERLQTALVQREAADKTSPRSTALMAKVEAETKALKEATEKLAAVLEKSFAIGTLTPLTPEQLAWSMMGAAGVVEAHDLAGAAEFDKKQPATEASRHDSARLAARTKFVEQYTWDKLKGGAAGFAPFFAAGAGEPQDAFFATADQALFLNNGTMMRSWLAPSADNLIARLGKLTEPRALAEELYLSTLTRLPSNEEVIAVQQQLSAREKDKPAVVQELAWGLLTSAEFRFKH